MKMMSLNEVKNNLHYINLSQFAELSGVKYQTLQAIRSGKNDNPTYKTMQAISNALDSLKANNNG